MGSKLFENFLFNYNLTFINFTRVGIGLIFHRSDTVLIIVLVKNVSSLKVMKLQNFPFKLNGSIMTQCIEILTNTISIHIDM